MSSEIICEIKFINSDTRRIISIIGKINKKQLNNPRYSFISVKNRVQKNQKWIIIESILCKSQIFQITTMEPSNHMLFDKQNFEIHKSILPNVS